MMDMRDVSTFFDNDPLYDAYTGDYLYDGQFATYDGSQLDGSFVRRRTVSLNPLLQLPPRRVVDLYGEKWVLSDPITDGFLGETVRQTMSARKAHDLYTICSAQELLKDTATWQAYGFCRWTKGTVQPSTSELQAYFEFSFSQTEPYMHGKFIRGQQGIWHARMAAEVAEGFQILEADIIAPQEELAESLVTVTKPGRLDPVTLQESPGVDMPGLLIERYSFYKQLDQAQAQNHAGDKTLVVAKVDMPEPTGSVSIAGQRWNILGVEDLKDGYGLHVRRV